MLPVRLEIKNFLPYRSTDPVRFEGIHLACLTGANGAGKSSLLDAITWALWGKARARHDEDLIHLGQQDMHVQLDFEQAGLIYRIIRKRTRKQRSTGTLDLLVKGGEGQFNPITEPTMRATQDRINQLLRLDYETFINSAFLQQGKADSFTTRTPKERKQILSDILGLALWEQYEATVREHLKQLQSQLEVYDLRVKEIDEELAKEPALKEVLIEAQQAEADAKEALIAAEARLAEYDHVPHDLRNARENLIVAQKAAEQLAGDVEAAAAEIDRHQTRIETYEQVIAAREEIETGYQTLQAAREASDDLSQKLLQLSDFDSQRSDLEKQLHQAQADLENEASGYRARIAELERGLGQDVAAELAQVQAEVAALQSLEQERQAAQQQSSTLGEERAQLEATNLALKTEMLALKDRLNRLEQADGALCPLCGQTLDEQHRADLVEQLTANGTERGDTYRGNEARVKVVVGEIAANKQRIGDLDNELRRLNPLLEQAGVLQAQADSASEAETRLVEARAALATVQTLLDDGAFAGDICEQLAALETQREAIGYDRETHHTAQEQLNQYQKYEQRQTELQIALNSLPDALTALQAAENRRERTLKVLSERQGQISSLESDIAQLEIELDEYRLRQDAVTLLRTQSTNAYERLVNARQELAALEGQRARKADLEARAEATRHQEGLYKELRLAFGKNGIPAMIIETAIPELEAEANDLLRRMTGGRMAVTFSTQREKKTGGMAETLDIQIADELGTRDYEMYSGGEAFRINFAIRVALSQMLARRAGAQLRTLFIDEGFGTQDADGRDRLIEAITAIQDNFDLILVITHIDELRDHFPVHVVVEKTQNGSRVSVR